MRKLSRRFAFGRLTDLQQSLGGHQGAFQISLLVEDEAVVVQEDDGVHVSGRLALLQLQESLSHPQLGVVEVVVHVRRNAHVVAVLHRQVAQEQRGSCFGGEDWTSGV